MRANADPSDDSEPPAPLWMPPGALVTFLHWLRQPRRLATAAVITSVVGLLRLWRRQARVIGQIRITPISHLLQAVEAEKVREAVISTVACAYVLSDGTKCQASLLPIDAKLLVKLLHKHKVTYQALGPSPWKALALLAVPFAYLGVCGYMLYRLTNDGGLVGGPPPEHGSKSGGGGAPPSIGWDDVAGLPGVKAAVMEVVDVMQRPGRYARLGARCPRGILLAGPPGTGKTLLARAVAGEACVPFLCCAGSDFVEVFVGRGAKRVRSLFDEAARRAPCVLFIDELDAIGTARSARGGGGSDEHDHTLNQLLASMDGMGAVAGVLVMGATNRLGALDPALTRPGRFDRVLTLELPDETGRLEILRVHASRAPLERPEAVLPAVAARTAGCSGAELANLVNEAAICAVRANDTAVRGEHFEAALSSFLASRAGTYDASRRADAGGVPRSAGPSRTSDAASTASAAQQQALQLQQAMWALLQGCQPPPPQRARAAGSTGTGIEEVE